MLTILFFLDKGTKLDAGQGHDMAREQGKILFTAGARENFLYACTHLYVHSSLKD